MRVRRYNTYEGNDFLSVINTDKYETIDRSEVEAYLTSHPDKFCVSIFCGKKILVFPGDIVYFSIDTPRINDKFFKDIIFPIEAPDGIYYLYKDGRIIKESEHKMFPLTKFCLVFESKQGLGLGYRSLISMSEEWHLRDEYSYTDRLSKVEAVKKYPQYFKIDSINVLEYNGRFDRVAFIDLIICSRFKESISVSTREAVELVKILEIDTSSIAFYNSYKTMKVNYDLFMALSDADKLKMEMRE